MAARRLLQLLLGALLLALSVVPCYYRGAIQGSVWASDTVVAVVDANLSGPLSVERLVLLYTPCPSSCNGTPVYEASIPARPGAAARLGPAILVNVLAELSNGSGMLPPSSLYSPRPGLVEAEWGYYTVHGRVLLSIEAGGCVEVLAPRCPGGVLAAVVSAKPLGGGCVVSVCDTSISHVASVEYGFGGSVEVCAAPPLPVRLLLAAGGVALLFAQRRRHRVL